MPAKAITGHAENVDGVAPLLHPARVLGYKRVAVRHSDYPAVIKNAGSVVEGYVLRPRMASHRQKLDDFEREAYKIESVTAHFIKDEATDKSTTQTSVDVDIDVWDGDAEKLSSEAWDLDNFIETRLGDWIDLFGGMELVGNDDR